MLSNIYKVLSVVNGTALPLFVLQLVANLVRLYILVILFMKLLC